MKNIIKFFMLAILSMPLLCANASAQTINATTIQEAFNKNPKLLEEVLRNNKEVLNKLVLEILQENSAKIFAIAQHGADVTREEELNAMWSADAKVNKKVNLVNRPTRGAASYPVTLVAFSDFTCSYCAQAAATVENLLAKYPNKIRFVFKQVPNPEDEKANLASLWFLASMAIDQKKGWNFYAGLFSNQQAFMADPQYALEEVAKSVGLDPNAIKTEMAKNNAKYKAIIAEDITDMKKIQLSGTPHFLMNNLVIRGAHPLADFISAYEFALKVK